MNNFFEQVDLKTIITIFAGFGAASTAQIISHLFSRKREDIKYQKECLQNLYSPVIFKIHSYLFGEFKKTSTIEKQNIEFYNEKYKEHSDNPERIFAIILETVGSNLQYAKPEIIMDYHDLVYAQPRSKYGKERIAKKVAFCNKLLLDYVQLCKKLKVNSVKINMNIEESLIFTQLYQLLGNTGHFYSQDLLIQRFLDIKNLRHFYLKKIMKLNLKFKKKHTIESFYSATNKSEELYKQIGQRLGKEADWWFSHISNPHGFLDDMYLEKSEDTQKVN
ncbi:hypothetical protein ACSSTO_13215 [Bacillus atrophaeus]|uniref:hypothetical protein n=1 Tax=Bacillus atrophaeus TaxID=1452 RepID=UPI003EDA5EAB